MNNKTISIEIDEKGNVSVEGFNFAGPECESFAKEISRALGTTTSFTKKKVPNMKTIIRQKERN